MSQSNKSQFITIEKCDLAELYGLSEEAIRQYKEKVQWRERIHWVKVVPNGRIFIRLKAVDEWIEGKKV